MGTLSGFSVYRDQCDQWDALLKFNRGGIGGVLSQSYCSQQAKKPIPLFVAWRR